MSTEVSVYGSTGFVGSRYCEMYRDSIHIPREENFPRSGNILYFISTTHNYYIFDEPHRDIDTNLNKLISVLEECRKSGNDIVFNFISSWFVYGMNCSMDTKETDACDPRGFYSITKRAAEQMLICYCNTFGMKYRILRLCNMIGPSDKTVSAKRNALQYMIGLLKKNEPIKLYDNGTNVRDFMHVDDACRAIRVCVETAPHNEIINISNCDGTPIGDAIKYAKDRLGSTSELIPIDPPHFHSVVQVKNVRLNNQKLLSYGYIPSINTWQAIETLL